MRTPNAIELLQIWEQGASERSAMRALLLVQSVNQDKDQAELKRWNIGQRDRLLLNLRNALFGPQVHCLTDCTRCRESIELDFRIDDVLAPFGQSEHAYVATVDGYEVKYRLPDSGDLLWLSEVPGEQAEWRLLTRCVLSASTVNGDVVVGSELPDTILSAVNREMSEVDSQAEIVLEVRCPVCSTISPATFDIVSHLWVELDCWAKRQLREVCKLASVFGWREADILGMSPVRRNAYLDLISS